MFNFFKRKSNAGQFHGTIDLDNDVEIMAFDGETLTFCSPLLYRVNVPLELLATVPQGEGRASKRRRAEFVVHEMTPVAGPAGKNMQSYEGTIEDASQELQTHIYDVLSAHSSIRKRQSGNQRGGGDRQMLTFAVISRDFKNFKAVSADISPSGVKVIADGEIAIGKQIELTMNFDDENFPSVKCNAEVMWCKPSDKKFAVGLRFFNLDERQQIIISRYMEFVMDYKTRMLRNMVD